MTMHLSRRRFAQMAGCLAIGVPDRLAAQPIRSRVSARQMVERLTVRLTEKGLTLPSPTIDGFKAGNPDQPVSGVATVFMSTWPVLRAASRRGLNFVISHEPTYWNHREGQIAQEGEARTLAAAKATWIADHGMVVWRFHDYWHARRPEPTLKAWVDRLGWGRFRQGDERAFTLPATTLGSLASNLRSRLGSRDMRVVGDRDMVVRSVAKAGHLGAQVVKAAQDHDVVIVSEAREFDAFDFIADCNRAGFPKGLIILSHRDGEEDGVQSSERWLRSFISEVPVAYVETPQPFRVA